MAGRNDLALCRNLDAYLNHVQDQGLIEEHHLMRRELGLAYDSAG